MILKVCGIKDQSNLEAMNLNHIDWIGFNFYPDSKRYLSDKLSLDKNSQTKRVGVFVKEAIATLLAKAQKHQLDIIQLHGDEEVKYCEEVKNQYPIIKVFRVDEQFDFAQLKAFNFADYFLFDTYTKAFGGSGKSFDWNRLNDYTIERPFLLSGGIAKTDATKILAFQHPQFVGIDINSKFETEPGIKNPEWIDSFSKQIKEIQ